MKKRLLIGLLSLSLFAVAGEYQVAQLKGKLDIDGELNEVAWAAAPKASDFTIAKKSGVTRPPKNKTEFQVLCDDENVYFGITCYEPGKVVANLKKEYHSNPWLDDVVEIFLCPNGRPSEFYQFVISAGGAHWQEYWAERGAIHPDPYFPEYEYATKVSEGKWVAEVRIPYNALYLTPSSHWKSKWCANVARLAMENYENSSWSQLRTNNFDSESFNFLTGMTAKSVSKGLYINDANFKLTQKVGANGIGTITASVICEDGIPSEVHNVYLNGAASQKVFAPGKNDVSWNNVTLDKSGKQQLHFVVKNSSGKCVHEREFPIRADFNELTVNFTSPQFSETFYPGEDATHLRADVDIAIACDKIAVVVAGKEYSFPVVDNHAKIDVDLKGAAFPLDVKVGTYKTQIQKVDKAHAWIHNGKVVLDGKPTVLLGWYGGDGWIWSKACAERYPTPAAKGPFTCPTWVTLEVPRILGDEGIEAAEMVHDREPSQKVYDVIRNKINQFRDKTDFFIYYLTDEPECRGLSPVYLRYLYKYIRKLDPTRLVMIVSRDPVRYLECADIVSQHMYFNPMIDDNGVRSLLVSMINVRDTCSSVGDLNRKDKVLMLTPQTFNYSFNDFYADYPTYDESRAACWCCLIRGGQGIYPYIYYDHFSRPGLNFGYTEIYESIARLNDWITGEKYAHLDVKNGDGALFSKSANSHLIAIVNLQPTQQTATATGLPNGSYYRFREDGRVEVKNNTLTMQLEPYQVLLLTSEKCDDKLETLVQLRKRIADAEYARNNRGNVLHGKGRQITLDFPESKPYTTQVAMEQQDKMFDGILDVSAWQPRSVAGDLWYEMSFMGFVPKFSKARIYGNALKGLTLKIWKLGEWVTPEAKVTDGKYSVELDFGKTLSTVKVHLDFVKSNELELYEFELVE